MCNTLIKILKKKKKKVIVKKKRKKKEYFILQLYALIEYLFILNIHCGCQSTALYKTAINTILELKNGK